MTYTIDPTVTHTTITRDFCTEEQFQQGLLDKCDFKNFEGGVEIPTTSIDNLIPNSVITRLKDEDGNEIKLKWEDKFICFTVEDKGYIILADKKGQMTWRGTNNSDMIHNVCNYWGAENCTTRNPMLEKFKLYLDAITPVSEDLSNEQN